MFESPRTPPIYLKYGGEGRLQAAWRIASHMLLALEDYARMQCPRHRPPCICALRDCHELYRSVSIDSQISYHYHQVTNQW
jgi:hypothetical protein